MTQNEIGKLAIDVGVQETARPTGRGPNMLPIMSDEHDPAVMGCAGDRLGTTPNPDRLAAGGVRFDAAYTRPAPSVRRHA